MSTAPASRRGSAPGARFAGRPRAAALAFLAAASALVAPFATPACRGPSLPAFDPEGALEKSVSGERAFAHLEALVALGPRPPGSESLEEARRYIETQLAEAGWTSGRDAFTARSPSGEEIELVNLRARFSGNGASKSKAGAAPLGVLGAPYGTKRYDSFEFFGANDGTSGAALLLELAAVFAERPTLASRLELVFLDGEEALGPRITPRDGLYGSRRHAAEWSLARPAERPRWALFVDGVGGTEARLRAAMRLPGEGLRELGAKPGSGYEVDFDALQSGLSALSGDLLAAAEDLGLRGRVGISPDYLLGSHLPLNVVAGVPALQFVDADYAYRHSSGDTLDKLSPASLETAGRVAVQWVERYRWRQ